MTIADLERLVASHAPGSLIPRDWLLEQLKGVDGDAGDPLADMTIEEAGVVLGRSLSPVREYCRRDLLPGAYRQRGREWKVPREAIRAFQRAEASDKKPPTPNDRRAPAHLSSWRHKVTEDS